MSPALSTFSTTSNREYGQNLPDMRHAISLYELVGNATFNSATTLDSIMSDDGNIYVLGYVYGTAGTTIDLYISKINPQNGSQIWNILILSGATNTGFYYSGNYIKISQSGNLYVSTTLVKTSTTYTSRIFKISPSGSVIWQREILDPLTNNIINAYTIDPSTETSYICCVNSAGTSMVIMSIDINGTIVTSKVYNPSLTGIFNFEFDPTTSDLLVTDSNLFYRIPTNTLQMPTSGLIWINSSTPSNSTNLPNKVFIDNKNRFAYSLSYHYQTTPSTAYVPTLTKYDIVQNSIVWQKYFLIGTSGTVSQFNMSFTVDSNQNVYISILSLLGGAFYYPTIIKLDNSGTLQYVRYLYDNKNNNGLNTGGKVLIGKNNLEIYWVTTCHMTNNGTVMLKLPATDPGNSSKIASYAVPSGPPLINYVNQSVYTIANNTITTTTSVTLANNSDATSWTLNTSTNTVTTSAIGTNTILYI